jgi:hypothetical protein
MGTGVVAVVGDVLLVVLVVVGLQHGSVVGQRSICMGQAAHGCCTSSRQAPAGAARPATACCSGWAACGRRLLLRGLQREGGPASALHDIAELQCSVRDLCTAAACSAAHVLLATPCCLRLSPGRRTMHSLATTVTVLF